MTEIVSPTSLLATTQPQISEIEMENFIERIPNTALEQRRPVQTNRGTIVVDVNGYGDFAKIEDAITYITGAGLNESVKVLVRKGTYYPNASISIPSNVILEGEGTGNTIIDFNATARKINLSGTLKTVAGGVSITEGTSTVTGASTSFTSAAAGDSIMIRGRWYTIATISTDTSLTISETFKESTASSEAHLIYTLNINSGLKNLTVKNANISGALVDSAGTSFLTIENVVAEANANAGGSGFRIDAAFGTRLHLCQAFNNTNHGFVIGDAFYGELLNCISFDNTVDGFSFTAATLNPKATTFTNCIAKANGSDGFSIGDVNASFIGCISQENDAHGFNDFGFGSIYMGCLSTDNDGDGWRIPGGDGAILLVGCRAEDNGAWGINLSTSGNFVYCFATRATGNTTGNFTGTSTSGTNILFENIETGNVTCANGANNNLAVEGLRFARITGPTAAFTISGFGNLLATQHVNGQLLTIYNTTTQDMTLTNNATGEVGNRILTLTGADVTLTGVSVANFIYSEVDSIWILLGTQG